MDPIAIPAPEPLWRVAERTELVLHAARQDLEVWLQAAGRLPVRIFDTQIAAALLGHPAQIGYAKLVESALGVSLPKQHTRTDWSRRPLPAAVLEYAADDVRYLGELRERLADELRERGRLEWAQEDSARLLEPSLYEVEDEEAWRRVKGIRRLAPAASGIARRLAAWRERRARSADRPRQWIMKDALLVALAREAPRSRAALAAVGDMPPALARRSGEKLLALIAEPGEPLPHNPGPPDEREKALEKALAQKVSQAAGRLGIDAEVLAPRKELRAIAGGRRDTRVFEGWRAAVAGEALTSLLD